MPIYPDISEVDTAIMSVLANDATLRGLMPDGVFWDVALPPGRTAFVIVSSLAFEADPGFQAGGNDRALYLVKAVARTPGGSTMRDAAARIHDLLQYGTLTLTNGYGLMVMKRIARVRFSAPDLTDPSVVWQNRGGQYEALLAS